MCVSEHYPRLTGIVAGIKSFSETCPGTILTDKLALAGTLMIFPEYAHLSKDLQLLITLGHHVDHHLDTNKLDEQSLVVRGFNTLYSIFLTRNLFK